MNSILGKWIKKRNKSDFVVLILLGVMVMIVAMPTGAKQSQKETQTQEQKEQQLQTEDSYKEQLQQQLKELLEHMDGVGKTRVMLTFSDEGTDQLDKNVTKDGNKKEETTVVYDTGDTRQPYVICRQMPKIEGVVVVAQGGGNAKTVTEISNAVMSLFPVEAHKVVVVKLQHRRGDRNTSLLLDLHPVRHRMSCCCLSFYGTGKIDGSSVKQELLRQSRLTCIRMGNDSECTPFFYFFS